MCSYEGLIFAVKNFYLVAPRRAPTPGSILLQRSSTTGGIRGQSPGKPKGSRTPRSPGSGISQGQISLKMPNRRDDEKKLSFDMIDEHARKVIVFKVNTIPSGNSLYLNWLLLLCCCFTFTVNI